MEIYLENDHFILSCSECGHRARAAIQLGEEPDYDSVTVIICEECLRKALAMLEANDGD